MDFNKNFFKENIQMSNMDMKRVFRITDCQENVKQNHNEVTTLSSKWLSLKNKS